jgi:pre-60S factor REI1
MDNEPVYTCLSCSIAFLTPEEQRKSLIQHSRVTIDIFPGDHYKSDHHRYNMKRRVAGMLPVGVSVFNQKVLDRKAETAIMTSPRGSICEVCK